MPVSPGASGMQPRDPCRPWRGTLASGHKPRSLPFPAGERLSYDLSWLAMRAGIATLTVQEGPVEGGRRRITLGMVARSSPVVTKFYPVDNRVASTVDVESFLPRHMTF